jgi:hypothetical protein
MAVYEFNYFNVNQGIGGGKAEETLGTDVKSSVPTQSEMMSTWPWISTNTYNFYSC